MTTTATTDEMLDEAAQRLYAWRFGPTDPYDTGWAFAPEQMRQLFRDYVVEVVAILVDLGVKVGNPDHWRPTPQDQDRMDRK